MGERALGRGATPVGDAAFDQWAAIIDGMIEERIARVQARLAEVTGAPSGADARVSVRVWDDDGDGQERVARVAGVQLARGDTVVVLPVGADDSYVVVSKVIHRAQDRAVVGGDELTAGAVTTAAIANDAVTQAKIGDGAVGTTQIANEAVTPAKLSQAYATPAQVDTKVASGVSGLAPTTWVNERIATRQPLENANNPYLTTNEGNRLYQPKGSGSGKVTEQDVTMKNAPDVTLGRVLNNLQGFMTCTNNNLKGGKKKPCNAQLDLFR